MTRGGKNDFGKRDPCERLLGAQKKGFRSQPKKTFSRKGETRIEEKLLEAKGKKA